MTASSRIVISLLLIISFLLGVIAYGIVAPSTASARMDNPGAQARVAAEGGAFGAVGSGTVMALAGNDQRGDSVLYLVDTDEQSVATYKLKGGDTLLFASTRHYGSDLQLARTLLDESEQGVMRNMVSKPNNYTPAKIRQLIERLEEKKKKREERK